MQLRMPCRAPQLRRLRLWAGASAAWHKPAHQPRSFPLPADIRNGPLTIAVRMWMDAPTPLDSPVAWQEPPS